MSVIDKILPGTFVALLKLLLKQRLESKMTLKVTRPGVGSSRYMINDNLVFFYQTGWYMAEEDDEPILTLAYFFPEDGKMMSAHTFRNSQTDRYDRRLGNDIAFDRLLDSLRHPEVEEMQQHIRHLSFDEDVKGRMASDIATCMGIFVGPSTIDATVNAAMEAAFPRKFRSLKHAVIQCILEEPLLEKYQEGSHRT
ncbi:MAG TPA: hypothetical protein VFM18_20545 [Methanosarcina sp.]|nr:hypothetical protein [Methanosarcina sp.]